jgi:hypothetical protein
MKEALIWEQGGITTILFTKTILSIESDKSENPNSKAGCKISVDYLEEPIDCSKSIEEVLRLLEIN